MDQDVAIYAKFGHQPGYQLVGQLDNDSFQVIRRQIAAKQQGGCRELVDKLLRLGKWHEGVSENEYQNSVLNPVLSIIHETSDVNVMALRQLVDRKNRYTHFIDTLRSGQAFNICDLLLPVVGMIFSDPEVLIRRLYDYSVTLARVGVGKGEIVLSMFTSATKGKTGDLLMTEIGEVEIKGTKGRPGKGKCALDSLHTIPRYLESKGFELYKGEGIRKHYIQAIKLEHEIVNYLDTIVNKAEFGAGSNLVSGAIKIRRGLDLVSDDLHSAYVSSNMFLKRIQEHVFEVLSCFRPCKYFGSPQINRLTALIEKYFTEVGTIINLRTNDHSGDIPTMSFTEMVKNAFNVDWGLTQEEYVQLLLHLINEESVMNNYVIVEEYRDAISSIVTPDRYERLIKGDYHALKSIIAAIHTVSYHYAAGFRTILWINDTNMNALPMRFDENNPKSKLRAKYMQFLTGSLKIDPGMDPQSATGVQVSYVG